MSPFRRIIAAALSLSVLTASALMQSWAAADDTMVSGRVTQEYTTREGTQVQYQSVTLLPNTDSETPYLYSSNNQVAPFGTAYYRVADYNGSFIYQFTGEVGQTAFLSMDIAHEFQVEVSADRTTWTQELHFKTNGRYREMRSIDLSPYFEQSGEVYVRFSDGNPSDGWGTSLYSTRYVTVTGAQNPTPAYTDVSDGWLSSAGGTVSAGQVISAAAGSQVTFSRYINLPESWVGEEVSLSIPWARSESIPVVKVDGREAASSVNNGYNLTIPLSDGSAGKAVTVEITLTATDEGECGLYNRVRAGFTDMVTMPEAEWTLGDDTRTMYRNYYKDGSDDLVLLNSLAGNYMNNLFDGRYGVNCFDGMMRTRELFYVHDTSRSIIALADEERFSPIVRLDTITDLYEGVRQAMVPGSDYEMFYKLDSRPKQVFVSGQNPKYLQMAVNQDNIEVFADVFVAGTSGGNTVGVDSTTVTDAQKETGDGMVRTYAYGSSGSAVLDVTWPGGTTDRPTTLSVTSQGTDSYSVIFNNFKSGFAYGSAVRPWSYASTADGMVAISAMAGDTEIAPPDGQYLILHSGQNAQAEALVVTWDVAPDQIILHSNGGNQFESLELVYGADAAPTLTAIPFQGIDGDLSWPIQVAENLVSRGVYGARGYDPSYVCGDEGLGPGALAAAAYIFRKYDSPLADQAEELALNAMDACYAASYERGVTPGRINDHVAGCGYLAAMGYEEYVDMADYWASFSLNEQRPDGSFGAFDARLVLALQRAWDITGLSKYREAVDRYKQSIAYYPDRIEYNGQTLTGHVLFLGGTELSYLGYDGDTANLANVFDFAANCIDDTGVFSCSDINPYFLGWSLNGTMEKKYELTEKKALVSRTQSVLYHADGSYEILDYPTAYINNPYRFSKRTLVIYGDVDNDGQVNASDALLALQASVNLRSLCGSEVTTADVNNDGQVNATDALFILQHSVDLIEDFPIEQD